MHNSNRHQSFILLFLLITTTACSVLPSNPPEVPQPPAKPELPSPQPVEPISFEPVDEAHLQDLAEGNTRFALDLYRQMQDGGGNLFFSPYSISLAMAMTYVGARSNTEQQMADVLNFFEQETFHPAVAMLNSDMMSRAEAVQDRDMQGFQLNIANSIWGQDGYAFQPAFLDILSDHYGAGMQLVDYINDPEGARKQINAWVEDETEDKIKDLIPQGVLDGLTRLVLANAIYFNAAWEHQFEESFTRDAPFNLLDGNSVDVPMMAQREAFGYAEVDGLQAIELFYEGREASMVIFLPETESYTAFEDDLDNETMDELLAALQPRQLELFMPKFTFESEFELVPTLTALGLQDPFDPQVSDFSGMDGTRGLYISNILHKAFVDVDEEGTEAAAATAVVMKMTSAMPEEPLLVRIDHPFIFLIKDNQTGSILFMGRVLDPR